MNDKLALGTGEKYLLEKDLEKARIEAVRAHEELKRAGPVEEHRLRLATLEAAINTTSQELQWRNKAMEELAAVIRCAELAEASHLSIKQAIRYDECLGDFNVKRRLAVIGLWLLKLGSTCSLREKQWPRLKRTRPCSAGCGLLRQV